MPSNRTESEAVAAASKAEAQRSKEDAEIVARAVNAADVGELRSAVVTLAGRVTNLSEALTVVNDIQMRQTETERKTAIIQKDAADTKKTALALTKTTVSKTEVEEVGRRQLIKEKEVRKETLFRIYQTAGAVIILILVIVLGLISYQKGQQGAIYSVCKARNSSYEKVLQVLQYQDPALPPPTAAQKSNLELLKQAFRVVDCEKLR